MKKRILTLLAAVLMLTSIPFVSSCKSETDHRGETATSDAKEKEKFSTYSFDYFDTVTTVVGYESSKEKFDAVANAVLAELAEYHRLFTIYKRFDGLENLCTVNELTNGEHREVTVDKRIIDMLLFAKDMYKTTNGTVNIAMGSVLSIWHDYRTEGMNDPASAALPPMDKLTEAAKHTNIDALVIDEANCTVKITDPQMTLDVGAIAKGYAVEMAARTLEENGIGGYVINVGGNVRTVGAKPDGTSWTAGIENPEDTSADYIALLELTSEALVTSGSYQRYYVVNGESYHHIIDPETLMPSKGYLSVSVVCPSSAVGDAFSTSLFCMPLEEGKALVEATEGIEAMWVMPDGTKHYSDGFQSYVTK